MARKAVAEGLPLVTDILLPLSTEFRPGKQIVRDGSGLAEGVVETTFAEIGWDFSRLEVVP